MIFKAFSAFLLFLFLSSSVGWTELALPEEDRILLEKIERDSIQYFVVNSDRETGLTRDSSRPGSPASIAATGFSLASLAIAQSRGWIPYPQAYAQIRRTLKNLLSQAQHQNGFFITS